MATQERRVRREGGKREKRRATNILVDGISNFIAEHGSRISWNSGSIAENEALVGDESIHEDAIHLRQHPNDDVLLVLKPEDIPKRYILYQPVLLLNSTFTSHSPRWQRFLSTLSSDQRDQLFSIIVEKFQSAGQHITHVAANAPIERQLLSASTVGPRPDGDAAETSVSEQNNVMRSPYNLQPLYGDFGPANLLSADTTVPSQADFDAAFWVQTSQVPGVWQTWAPQWTMFSHGNVREKSRILGQQGIFPGFSECELKQPLPEIDVVDFYVGIGYFAFPYLKRGVRRVFGWELNCWSVEGLKRGCEKNGWECLAVSVEDNLESHGEVVGTVVQALQTRPKLRCVIFQGDNKHAATVLQKISCALEDEFALNNRHCNLGLLPTSQGSWKGAVALLDSRRGGWLHVHENAEIAEVATKRQLVVDAIANIAHSKTDTQWQISCAHTEMVKTYAPGVGHYVFDVSILPLK